MAMAGVECIQVPIEFTASERAKQCDTAAARAAEIVGATIGPYAKKELVDRMLHGHSSEQYSGAMLELWCKYGLEKRGVAFAIMLGDCVGFGHWVAIAWGFDATNVLLTEIENSIRCGAIRVTLRDISSTEVSACFTVDPATPRAKVLKELAEVIDVLAVIAHSITGGVPLHLDSTRVAMKDLEKGDLVSIGSKITVTRGDADASPSFDELLPNLLRSVAQAQQKATSRSLCALSVLPEMKRRTPASFASSSSSKFEKDFGTSRGDSERVKSLAWGVTVAGATALRDTLTHPRFPRERIANYRAFMSNLCMIAEMNLLDLPAFHPHYTLAKTAPSSWSPPPLEADTLNRLVELTAVPFRKIPSVPTDAVMLDRFRAVCENDTVAGTVSQEQKDLRASLTWSADRWHIDNIRNVLDDPQYSERPEGIVATTATTATSKE